MKKFLFVISSLFFIACSGNKVEKEFIHICEAIDMNGIPNSGEACKCIVEMKMDKIDNSQIEKITSQDDAKIKFLSKKLYDETRLTAREIEYCARKLL